MMLKTLILGMVTCFPVVCSAAESDADALTRLHAEIVEMIGTPTCTNVVHCRLLSLGSLPCGGAAEFLAYASTMTANTGLLETKAAEFGFLQEELQKGRPAGECKVLIVPKLACVNSHCALVVPNR